MDIFNFNLEETGILRENHRSASNLK